MNTYSQIIATQQLWATQPNPPSIMFAYHMGVPYFVVEDYRPILRVISTDGKGMVYVVNKNKATIDNVRFQYLTQYGTSVLPTYEIEAGSLTRISCPSGVITSADKFVKDEIRKIWYG